MPYKLDLTDAEFDRIMEEIDSILAARSPQISGRDIRGMRLFCQRFQLNGIGFFDPLLQRVAAWFSEKYGERLNMALDFGDSMLPLRTDLFKFRCTRFYGRLALFCLPELFGRKLGNPNPAIRDAAYQNVLENIEGVTPKYAASMTPAEHKAVLIVIANAFVRWARIESVRQAEFIEEARGDMAESVNHLMRSAPQYGQSKWSSSQAVEKFLKSFIDLRGGRITRNHYLDRHCDNAEALGLSKIDRIKLGSVQCPADVRYDAELVSRHEAVVAHEAALSICAEIATQLPGDGWNSGALGWSCLTRNGVPHPDIPLIVLARTKDHVPFIQI